jgi:hypothetical protein
MSGIFTVLGDTSKLMRQRSSQIGLRLARLKNFWVIPLPICGVAECTLKGTLRYAGIINN